MSRFEEAFDVAVIGGGGSGLAAAAAAAELGAQVKVFEGQSRLGGKTALAMGSLTAAETSVQRERGLADARSGHRSDLLAFLGYREADLDPRDPSLDIVVDDGAGTIDWLRGLGVQFSGPHPERPHSTYRMHCAVPDGSAYVERLHQRVAELGGQVQCGTPLAGLTRTEAGWLLDFGPTGPTVRARAVVLATGDYSAGLARFGLEAAGIPISSWARGDGQYLAAEAGAVLSGMDRPPVGNLRFLDPPRTEPDTALAPGAIVVDAAGARLDQDGTAWRETPAIGQAAACWLVFGQELVDHLAVADDDSGTARDGWQRRARLFISTAGGRGYDYLDDVLTRKGCAQADRVDTLAAEAGIDAAGLNSAIRTANEQRSHLGTGAQMSLSPPYVALGPLALRLLVTDGGIRISDRLEALGHDQRPIAGLFAAGLTTATIGFKNAHGHGIGWAMASGRRAGLSAARFAAAGGTLDPEPDA